MYVGYHEPREAVPYLLHPSFPKSKSRPCHLFVAAPNHEPPSLEARKKEACKTHLLPNATLSCQKPRVSLGPAGANLIKGRLVATFWHIKSCCVRICSPASLRPDGASNSVLFVIVIHMLSLSHGPPSIDARIHVHIMSADRLDRYSTCVAYHRADTS